RRRRVTDEEARVDRFFFRERARALDRRRRPVDAGHVSSGRARDRERRPAHAAREVEDARAGRDAEARRDPPELARAREAVLIGVAVRLAVDRAQRRALSDGAEDRVERGGGRVEVAHALAPETPEALARAASTASIQPARFATRKRCASPVS